MGQPSNLTINIIDNTIGISTPDKGIAYVQGVTRRGPINDPVDLITSERQFDLIFGDDGGMFTLLCKRMISKGVVLRVNRVAHATPASPLSSDFVSGANGLFAFTSKYPGTDYNAITVEVLAASNAETNYFDLKVTHTGDTLVYEYYPNLTIVGIPTVALSNYLEAVTKKSNFIVPVYKDLSGFTGPLRPTNASKLLNTSGAGSNGGSVDATDYIGSTVTKTGLFAFDNYDDGMILACPHVDEDDFTGLLAAGFAYAATRKDLIYFHHLSNANITSTTLLSARSTHNSPYLVLTAGGLVINHPVTGAVYEISELADVIAAAVAVHNKIGEWRSFTGQTFGVLPNTLGVVNNFGTPAQLADLKILANRQVNMVVRKNNITYLNDDYTSKTDPSAMNFASIMFMIIFVTKSLRPTLEKFLGYPNTFTTWEQIFYTVKPFLDSMVAKDAWFSYEWKGDQFTTSLNNLQINNSGDVLDGKYRVRLEVISIAPLKDFVLDFVLDQTTGVSTDFNS